MNDEPKTLRVKNTILRFQIEIDLVIAYKMFNLAYFVNLLH